MTQLRRYTTSPSVKMTFLTLATWTLLMLGVVCCLVFVLISDWTNRNMGSTFLPGMLSEKEPVGFFIDYEQLDAAGDTAVDNEAPTPDDWDNL